MNTGKTIRKILFIAVWLAIGAGMVTLLAAAIRKQKNERCSNYIITIKGGNEKPFIDKKEITRLLTAGTKGKLKDQPMASFDLMKLEELLEDNVWIRDAELYFDNNDVLHVTVTERQPLARIFTRTGRTFYIDAEEKQMPVSDRVTARVPVFTGFPVRKIVSKRDRELLHEVKLAAEFIQNDSFWSSQVSQMDITPEREFEMVPVVGNHTVKLGAGRDLEAKFRRLFIFYRNILSKTGFEKYETIDVQYAGQVIGVKGKVSKVDSVLLRRNVEKLLQLARDMQNDSLMRMIPVTPKAATQSAETSKNDLPATSLNKPAPPVKREPGPNPVNSSLSSATTKKKPKALMPSRNEQ